MNDHKKKEIGPSTLLNPVPVIMLSCRGTGDKTSKNNIITLAWVGTVNSDPPMLSVSVRKSRFSYDQIIESGEFVVNLVDKSNLRSCDYCGVKSGRDVDKFAACSLSAVKAPGLELAPAIAECPVSLSCKVRQSVELGSHVMFIAEIISITVDEKLFNKNGKLEMQKAGLVAYSHGEYFALSGLEGFFGFSVAKPEVLRRRSKKRY